MDSLRSLRITMSMLGARVMIEAVAGKNTLHDFFEYRV
jgi:hypothetical protein